MLINYVKKKDTSSQQVAPACDQLWHMLMLVYASVLSIPIELHAVTCTPNCFCWTPPQLTGPWQIGPFMYVSNSVLVCPSMQI